MAQLRLTLLGQFKARLNSGETVDIPGTKAVALITCLALEQDGSLSRAKLLHLLWGDRSESQARASLRQLLWALRKSLQSIDPLPLVTDDESVTLLPELIHVDVLEFERLAKSDLPEDLAAAVNLYKGELLEDLVVRDAMLEERLFYERERLRKLALDALQRLLQHQTNTEHFDEAVATAQKILSIDPLHEVAHRHLIRHFLQTGHAGLAVEQFKRCRDTFRRELGVEPSDETTRLLQEAALSTGDEPVNTATYQDSPGEQHDKGFDNAVRVDQELGQGESIVPSRESNQPEASLWRLRVSVAAIVLIVTGGVVFLFKPWVPHEELTSVEHIALPLPNKPSIAVLPFINMGGDPEQEYFTDGITEDLTTDLSKISGLFVISRNSAFTYKGKTVTAKEVASDLGVRYILEGSVRRAGDQVRINAQLIDTDTDSHLWAERYDGSLADIFNLQDRVTRKIITALSVNLTPDEQARQTLVQTSDPEAYDAFLQGWSHYLQDTRSDFGKALEFFERAIELDPDYARAHAALAGTYISAMDQGWQYRLHRCHAKPLAEEHLRLAMQQPNALAHRFATVLRVNQGRHDEAITEAEQAVALAPNDAENYNALGYVLNASGRAAEAIEAYEKAMQLNPHYPARYLQRLGFAYFGTGQYKQAAAHIERARKRNSELQPWVLMASYGYLGRKEDAAAVLKEFYKIRGWVESEKRDVDVIIDSWNYKHRADAERLGKGLIKAGMCCEDKLEKAIDNLRPDSRLFRDIEFPGSYELPDGVATLTEAEIRERIIGNTMIGEYDGAKDPIYYLPDGTLSGLWRDVRWCNYWAVSGPVLCVGIDSQRYCETLALKGTVVTAFDLNGTAKATRELVQGKVLEP